MRSVHARGYQSNPLVVPYTNPDIGKMNSVPVQPLRLVVCWIQDEANRTTLDRAQKILSSIYIFICKKMALLVFRKL